MLRRRVKRLTALVPNAGVVYNKEGRVTSSNVYDQAVRLALTAHGRNTRAMVDEAFAEVLATAASDEDVHTIDNFCDALRPRVSWATTVPPAAFGSLFVNLIKARAAYQDFPRQPYDSAEHCKTAKAVDSFLKFIGDDWNTLCVDIELFEIPEDAGDEEDDEGVDFTQVTEIVEQVHQKLEAQDMTEDMNRMDLDE
ncbi:hypothetical protein GGR57DRAFT_511136 [Xylariaceae sp. FL1272]|nr:hypothetical protein GGR57DRAFT_511136 [Xylariaceae sp. FL1272]